MAGTGLRKLLGDRDHWRRRSNRHHPLVALLALLCVGTMSFVLMTTGSRSDETLVPQDTCECFTRDSSSENFRFKTVDEGTPHAFRMYTYPENKKDYVSKAVMTKGVFQPVESGHIMSVLQRDAERGNDAVLVDVGANIGWFTFYAASRGYKTISFEPLPANRAVFCETYCANPQLQPFITLYHIGLSDQDGVCFMRNMGEVNEGNAQMFCEHDDDHVEPLPEGERHAQIPVRRLDDVLRTRASIMKIDVEVYTNYVLRGARDVLDRNLIGHIQSELWNFENTSWPTFKGIFDSSGYEVHEESFEGCIGTAPKVNNVKEYYVCQRGSDMCSTSKCGAAGH